MVRGRFFAFAALVALVVALPVAASRHSTTHFAVVSAKATATLTFHTTTGDQNSVSDGKISLVARRKAAGGGSLPGRVLAPLKGKLSERVKTKRRASPTSQYQEQTCAQTRKVKGRGGVTLQRSGSRVRVGWAFPQAKPSFCRGPAPGKSVRAAMTHLYSESRFNASTVTVVVAGSRKIRSGRTTLTYRWRATVKLARS